jgi:uncharacterized membrane protein YphA (DoxX/SURF4 family)
MRTTKILAILARIAMGGLFVFSGSNKLFPFMTIPPMPPPAAAFIAALAATGYMIPLLGLVEVVFGLLLIAGRFIPLALVVLAPLVVNIALFHLVLEPMLPVVVILLASELYLAWLYRAAFRALLQPTAPRTPHAV